MPDIFDRLEREWHDGLRHAANVCHRHGSTIAGNQPQPQQEPVMPLADTASALKGSSSNLRASLENGASALREALDNHMAQIDAGIADVDAVAQIADHPAMQAMEKALPVVPAAILQGVTTMLEAVVAEHSKTAEAAPEQQAA
jgi:hypothetical protein